MIKTLIFVLAICAGGVLAKDVDHAMKKRHFAPIVHHRPVVAPLRPVVVAPRPFVFRPPAPIVIRRPVVRIVRPRWLHVVRITIVGRVDFEGFINHLLDILLRHRLIDVRTGGFFLSRLGLRGRGLLQRVRFVARPVAVVGRPVVRPVIVRPQIIYRAIQRLFIRGHPVARNRLLASLKIIQAGRFTPEEVSRILLEFILDNGVLTVEQVSQLTSRFGVRVTVTTNQPPKQITVYLSRVSSINVRADALPSFIVRLLERLVAKSIIPAKTAVNILVAFGVPVPRPWAKHPGKPISKVTKIKVLGAPLPKAKFVNVLIKILNGDLPQSEKSNPLSPLAKLLIELLIDNDVFTIENVSQFTTKFGVTVKVEKSPVPEDEDIFDLPEPDENDQQESSEEDDSPEVTEPPPPPPKPTAGPRPRPTVPAPVHTSTSKVSFIVTISGSLQDDNSPFVNNLLELVANKGLLLSEQANSILATFGVKGGAKYSGSGAELNAASIPTLRVGGNGDASDKFLKSLASLFRDKISRVAYSRDYFELRLIKFLSELALDNEIIDGEAAGQLFGQNAINAEIQGTQLTTETDIDFGSDFDFNIEQQ